MLTAAFSIPNRAWCSEQIDPLNTFAPDPAVLSETVGRFAAAGSIGDDVWLVRDKLGLNKLFASLHEQRGLIVANYLHELVDQGVPFDTVFAIPAGTIARVDPARRYVEHQRYFSPVPARGDGTVQGLSVAVADLRAALLSALGRIKRCAGPTVSVCLSGGLDSAVVAAYAVRVFDEVRAYTYSYQDRDDELSDDFRAAQTVADHLGLTLTPVTAGPERILEAVDDALRYGQDWRDFNVHCAIVNVVLARAMAAEEADSTARRTVLTGDLMNEFLADYSPVLFEDVSYYRLPRLPLDRLRRALIVGLQAGDREVGVFNAFGIDVLQPYAMCCDELLRIPTDSLARGGKRAVMEELAGTLLPEPLFARTKVRAQIGDENAVRGILPLMLRAGRDERWLEARFAAMCGTTIPVLRRSMRAGIYRTATAIGSKGADHDGYLRV